MDFNPPTTRRARLRCVACGNEFDASARRVRMVLTEKASRLCNDCRRLKRQQPIKVTAEHRRYWTDRINVYMFYDRESGEMVLLTQAWIDEMVKLIWPR